MSDISVVFDADTGRFRASVDAATQTVSKASEAVAAAKNKILDSFNAQVDAAAKLGVSHTQLASIQTKAAQSMASVTDANATKIINSLDRIATRQKAVAAELATLKVPYVQDTSEVTDRMRASALLRGGGLRAAENFASQFSGFNTIATMAFPIVGAAAFAAEIVRTVTALHEMYETAVKLPDALKTGFESLNAPIEENVDSLRKANDELEISIAKLERKPANNLALAIDEARINADHLASSADNAADKVKKLLEENKAGLGTFILTGATNTGPVSDEVNKRMSAIRDMQRDNRDAVRSGNDTPEAEAKRVDKITAALKDLSKWAQKSRTDIQSFNQSGQSNDIVNILAGVQDYADNTLDEQDQQTRNTADQQKQKSLQQQQEQQRLGQEAANKANAQRLKAMEDFANVWQTEAPVSAKAIFDYWTAQREAFSKGSSKFDATTQIDAIDAKLKSIVEEGTRAAHEAIQKLRASMQDKLELPRTDGNVMGNNTASSRALNAEYGKSNLEGDLLTAEAAKAKVAIDLADGSIDKLTADQRLAAIAATEHAARLADLNKQIADLKNSSGSYNSVLDRFGSDKDQQQYVGLNSQVTKENSAASIEAMQSAAKVAGDTWSSALKDANAKWVQDSQDSAQQVVALYRQAIDGLNKSIIDLMNGKNSFANYFKGIGNTLANDGLRRAESGIMNGLGIGKPDGSAANPLHVIMSAGSTVGGAIGSAASSVGSGIGQFFMGLFGGARALGGDVSVGHVYRINEQGQELFAPSVSGKMIPHSSTGTTGNGTVYYNVEVANGVTPTQMRMHVQEALKQYHPYGVSAAVAAVSERRQRSASSAK